MARAPERVHRLGQVQVAVVLVDDRADRAVGIDDAAVDDRGLARARAKLKASLGRYLPDLR